LKMPLNDKMSEMEMDYSMDSSMKNNVDVLEDTPQKTSQTNEKEKQELEDLCRTETRSSLRHAVAIIQLLNLVLMIVGSALSLAELGLTGFTVAGPYVLVALLIVMVFVTLAGLVAAMYLEDRISSIPTLLAAVFQIILSIILAVGYFAVSMFASFFVSLMLAFSNDFGPTSLYLLECANKTILGWFTMLMFVNGIVAIAVTINKKIYFKENLLSSPLLLIEQKKSLVVLLICYVMCVF